MKRGKKLLLLAAGSVVCFPALGMPAFSGEPVQYTLRIDRQPLSRALQQFARQSGVQVIFFSKVTDGYEAPPLRGKFTSAEAIQRLLNDSHLTFREINPHTIEIRPQAAVNVLGGSKEGSADIGDNRTSPATYAAQDAQAAQAESAPATTSGGGASENTGAGPGALEEIIVSAQKRLERLQDVPVAVTAISGEALASKGITSTAGLANLAPSLTYTGGAHPSNNNFRIRGVGTAVFGAGLEPTVSVVVDGVPMARNAQGFSDLSDIERVEVLRGPQGTLFGKNATGGVINIVTKAPSREFQSTLDLTAAQDQEYRVRGSISGPISDTLTYRVSTFYNNVGGITDALTTGHEVDGLNSYGARGKLRWEATDRLTLNFLGDFSKAHADCCSSLFLQVNNPLLTQLLGPVTANMNNRSSLENLDSWYETRQATGALEVNFDLGGPQLTSLTAYQSYHVNNNQPIDGLNTPVPLSLPVTNGSFDINGGPLDLHQFSQEVRVSSTGDNTFNYTAGLFYLDLSVDRGFIRRTGACAPGGSPPAFGQPCITPLYRSNDGFFANNKTKNAAAFAQGDMKVVGDLSALAGVRVQHEKVSFFGNRPDLRLVAGDLPLVGVTPSTGSGETSETAVTGKLGLKYAFSHDSQAYLTWSTGYKGAGYGVEFATDFANNAPVKPEHAKAWELGYKSEMLDGRMRMDAAVFYATYKDLQVQANRGDANLGIVRFVPTNAGSSVSKGVELEFTARPLSALTFNGGVTYLLTSVDIDGLNCPLSAQAAAPVVANAAAPDNFCFKPTASATPIQNVRGGLLPNAPRWRGTLNAQFDHDIPGTRLGGFFRLGAVTQSKMNFVIEQDPLTTQGAYTIVDASIGLRDQDDKYRLSLFVDNLFDRNYVTLLGRAATLTTATVTPNQLTGNVPKDANRYFGATVSVSF